MANVYQEIKWKRSGEYEKKLLKFKEYIEADFGYKSIASFLGISESGLRGVLSRDENFKQAILDNRNLKTKQANRTLKEILDDESTSKELKLKILERTLDREYLRSEGIAYTDIRSELERERLQEETRLLKLERAIRKKEMELKELETRAKVRQMEEGEYNGTTETNINFRITGVENE